MNPSSCKPIRQTLVTQSGMVPSQPGISVSYSGSFVGGPVRLNVRRHYPDLPNEWGGRGRSKPLDCDGMLFADDEAAKRYAYERGYLQRFRSRQLHERHLEIERATPGYFYAQRLKVRALFNDKRI